jgi:hypothetical protein
VRTFIWRDATFAGVQLPPEFFHICEALKHTIYLTEAKHYLFVVYSVIYKILTEGRRIAREIGDKLIWACVL